jgi:N-acetylmuramoyl-L-alanine amidase
MANIERPVVYKAALLIIEGQNQPRRLYLDLKGARLTPKAARLALIGDGLLRSARADQLAPDTVRLALDINSLRSYKIFTLDNPFRVVVDCFAQPAAEFSASAPPPTPPSAPAAPAPAPEWVDKTPARKTESPKLELPALAAKLRKQKVPRGTAKETPSELGLASQLGLRVKRVVLDPGHGGKDPGAAYRGLIEKELTLDIARRAASKVAKLLGVEVLLTRNKDVFMPLEERTAFANTREADLFVSIHINAAPNASLSGIETYFLSLATDEASMRVAARENVTTKRSISDLQVILNDLMLNSRINESNRLARALHKETLDETRKVHLAVQDLKVRQAPFYVLIGANMPAVLTEVGFITNLREAQRLADPVYRDKLAEGIAQGLQNYVRQLKFATR